MTDRDQDGCAGPAEDASRKTEEFLRLLGQVFSNIYLYSIDHKVTVASMDSAYDHLMEVLDELERLNLSITEDDLLIDGELVDLSNPLIQMLARKLQRLNISGFSFSKGISKDELKTLIRVINQEDSASHAQGNFAQMVTSEGLAHVKAESVTYRRVTDEEAVVSRDELALGGAGGKGAHEAESGGGDPPEDDRPEPPPVHIENILAFLKGEVTSANEKVLAEAKEVASDADTLAELIMQSVVIRQQAGDIQSGEPFGDIVVGCLKRTYEVLSQRPNAKTQKGQKETKSTLMLLEKELLNKMRSIAAEGQNAVVIEEQISGAVEDILEDLDIDALTGEYAKKHNAAAASEKKLVQYMKGKTAASLEDSGLQERMMEAGITPQGWQQLLVRSESEPAGGPGGAGTSHRDEAGGGSDGETGMLAVLLAQLLDRFDPGVHGIDGADSPDELSEAIDRVDREVTRVVDRAEEKLGTLETAYRESMEETQEPGIPEPKKGSNLTKRHILEILAEVVQELRQPLSVIHCAVHMIRGKTMGAINAQQEDILSLAETSGVRMSSLIDRLIEISGLPSSMYPDRALLGQQDDDA